MSDAQRNTIHRDNLSGLIGFLQQWRANRNQNRSSSSLTDQWVNSSRRHIMEQVTEDRMYSQWQRPHSQPSEDVDDRYRTQPFESFDGSLNDYRPYRPGRIQHFIGRDEGEEFEEEEDQERLLQRMKTEHDIEEMRSTQYQLNTIHSQDHRREKLVNNRPPRFWRIPRTPTPTGLRETTPNENRNEAQRGKFVIVKIRDPPEDSSDESSQSDSDREVRKMKRVTKRLRNPKATKAARLFEKNREAYFQKYGMWCNYASDLDVSSSESSVTIASTKRCTIKQRILPIYIKHYYDD